LQLSRDLFGREIPARLGAFLQLENPSIRFLKTAAQREFLARDPEKLTVRPRRFVYDSRLQPGPDYARRVIIASWLSPVYWKDLPLPDGLFGLYFVLVPLMAIWQKQNNILVLGDSHVKVFEHWQFLLRLPQIYFNVVSVQGATASGLDNPNSKTQAYKVFTEAIEHKNKKRGAIIICLGEVDTGFIIWYRAQKYNQPVGEIFTQTIEKYISFLSVVASQVEHLIVISAPCPQSKMELNGARLQICEKK
jgi:hypothetical protein